MTSDVSGRVTEIMFEAGARVKAGSPLVQLFDAPEQADLASFQAQETVAQPPRSRQRLAPRQFGPQATVDPTQAAFDQAPAGIAKTEAIISQKLVRAPFDGDSACATSSRPVSDGGHADRDTDRRRAVTPTSP